MRINSKCPKCKHDINEHTFSLDYQGCDICKCDLHLGDHIAALEARLREAEEVIKPLADLFPHLERRMKGDEDGTYYEINSGGLPDAKITLKMTRRAARWLKEGRG